MCADAFVLLVLFLRRDQAFEYFDVLVLATVCSATYEGTRFAVAIPYAMNEYESELIFNAKDADAVVTIMLPCITQIVNVPAGGAARYMLNTRLRLDDGVENKGILVTSDNPITVHVGTDNGPWQESPEATIVRPLSPASTFFPLATFKGNTGQHHTRPDNFYIVVANESDTSIEVYFKDGDGFVLHRNVTLDTFDVLTYDVFYDEAPSHDFTDGYVMSDKPISVYSGVGHGYCFVGIAVYPSWMYESMPRIDVLGTQYVTVPIRFGSELDVNGRRGGYYVRVIAAYDNTTVRVPERDYDVTLEAEEYYQIDHPNTSMSFWITCSRTCMAAQYTKQMTEGGSDYYAGKFMLVLKPTVSYSHREALFTTPLSSGYENTQTALALIVEDTEKPVEGFSLNGASLTGLNWRKVVHGDYWYATMLITPGTYSIKSINPQRGFASYLYNLRNWFSVGLGVA